jgi:hypothetical protein
MATGLADQIFPLSPTYVDDFGVVPGTVSAAQRLANTIGMNNAIAAAFASNTDLQFGPFTYQIDGTVLIWNTAIPAGVTAKCPMVRALRFVTRIEQWHAAGGIDTIHIGPPVGNPTGQGLYGGGIQDLWLVSMIDQTSITPQGGHLGAQLSITGVEQCIFSGIAIGEISQRVVDHNHFSYNALAMDSASGAFSCVFRDIEIKGYGNQGFDEYGTSGNFHYNIMIRNGGLGEPSLKTSTGSALRIFNAEGVFDQINLEWSTFGNAQPAMYIPSSAGVKFGHLHMEGLQQSNGFGGGRAALILVGGAGMVRCESMHLMSTNWPTGCGLTSVSVFGFGFSGNFMNVSIGEMLISQTLPLGTGVNFYLVNTYEGAGAGTVTNAQVDFTGPFLFFGDGGGFGSKLTGWSDCNFAATNRGPLNGLGVPPSNLQNGATLTITSASPGYSAGTYTQTNYDGASIYLYNQATNGTINLAQTIDPVLLPVSTPMFPGVRRRIINGTAANTLAVHNADTTNILTAATLSTGQWVDVVFLDTTGKWKEVAAGTLL